ncbi:MAG: DUF1570 domain-containing protein [Pirellulales bacterium]|nr:DUF1570 domain-containing protein [Pirellulales bacterium]
MTVVLALLTLSESAHAQGWADRRQIGPVTVRSAFSLTAFEPLLVEVLEVRAALTTHLGVPAVDSPIEIYLLADERSYRRYLGRHFPDVPYRRALFIKARGRIVVLAYRHKDLATDLRHESTHAFLHSALPMVPLWLDEGLAEYFEAPPSVRAGGNAHLNAMRWYARFGRSPSLIRLEAITDLSQMGPREYRESWAWVHFCMHGPKSAHDALVAYLADIRRHTPPGNLSDRLTRSLGSPRAQLAAHLRQVK